MIVFVAVRVEENIPIPPAVQAAYRFEPGQLKALIAALRVRNSVWLPFRKGLNQNCHQIAARLGVKVETRITVKDGFKGVRVWRVENEG